MALKSPNWGIGMRGPTAPNSTMQDIRHFYIIEVHWADAQPSSGIGIAAAKLSDIQSKVTAARNYNAANTRSAATVVYTGNSQAFSFTGTDVTAGDVGQYVYSPQNIPLGTKIASVNAGAHTGTFDTPAHAGGTGIIIGQPQGLRLRVECGQYAPSWAYGGTSSLTIKDNSGNPFVIPPWWVAGSQSLLGIANLGPVMYSYAQFMQALAGAQLNDGLTVDATPEIREVTVGLTMVKFGEVFFRFAGKYNNNSAYTGAGFTGALDNAALKRSIDIHAACFKNTITQIDLNTYDSVNSDDAGFGSDYLFTQDLMDYCVGAGAYAGSPALAGVQFTNASMISGSSNATLYGTATSGMMLFGPLGTGDASRNGKASISFQTYPETQVTSANIGATLARCIGLGATSVESISSSGSDTYTVIHAAETAQPYDQQLMQNVAATLPASWPWTSNPGPPNPPPTPQLAGVQWHRSGGWEPVNS